MIPARTPTPSKSLAIESLHKSIIFHDDIGFRVGELAFPLGRCCKQKKPSILIGNHRHFFRTCVFRLGCCKSKKSIEWLHQQRHIFLTCAPTAMGASFLNTKVGPEWSLFGTRVTFLMKNHENSIITLDQWSLGEKSACGRYGVNAFFYFCNPSNVLDPIRPSERTLQEVNLQRSLEKSNIHFQR